MPASFLSSSTSADASLDPAYNGNVSVDASAGRSPSDYETANDTDPIIESKRAVVKQWTNRIRAAKRRFEKDFQRIRDNQDFAAGLQWNGQETIVSDKYINNIVMRAVNQMVSSLYARDPQASIRRRERMDYALWDGKLESLQAAMTAVQMAMQSMLPAPPEAIALLTDYQQGRQWEEMLDKVGNTLKILYHYQIDEQEPEFKEQMKQLVCQVAVCGVAYTRISYKTNHETPLGSNALGDDTTDRIRRIRALADQFEDTGGDQSSAIVQTIHELAASLISSQAQAESAEISEGLQWSFPSPLSIIVDPHCTSLMGFVGAEWIAKESILPIGDVNAFFDCDIKAGGNLVLYTESGAANEQINVVNEESKPANADPAEALACVWEVFNNRTKSRFYICDGWKDYLAEPEAVTPKTHCFWPVHALTFNRVAVDPGRKASVYPASVVDLMRSPQKEWNRSREELREHRKANAPTYVVARGVLTDDDIAKLREHAPSEVIQLGAVAPGTDVNTVIQRMEKVNVDPMLYDTNPLSEDIMLATGSQQANLGNAQQEKDVSATASTIAEQSRISTVGSNVDDLDGFLTRMAKAGGEMLLRTMPSEVVKQCVGRGAVFPETDEMRNEFINAMFLETKAASSGRPNQALEIANWSRLAPIMQAAGANPMFMVEETASRLDDRIDIDRAFPLMPPGMPTSAPNAALASSPANNQQEQGAAPKQLGPGGPQPQSQQQ